MITEFLYSLVQYALVIRKFTTQIKVTLYTPLLNCFS